MLRYALLDMLRNPRRSAAAIAGVALAVGLVSGIAFFVDSSAAQMTARAIAPVAVDMQAEVKVPLAPAPAASAPGLDAADLARQVRAIAGVTVAEPVALVDLPAGALRSTAAVHNKPIKLLAIGPSYARHLPAMGLSVVPAGSALASRQTADLLAVPPGQVIQLTLPGAGAPVPLTLAGVVDLTRATPLFVSRNPDNQGEAVAAPFVLVVDYAFYQQTVLPALRLDAAAATPVVTAPPVVEVDILLDRAALSADPTAAVIRTAGLRRTIERISPGDITTIDHLTDTLSSARKDTTLAKVLFIFLGLPGVLLAAYLSRYAGGLLAESQRRDRAMLRARGIRPGQLARVLGFNAIAVAAGGSIVGLGLGAAAMLLLLGRPSSSSEAVLTSVLAAVATGLLTTLVALYLPARRSLSKEVGEERRDLAVQRTPAWLRARLDLAFLAAAAVVGAITYLTGGYKPTPVEGQSISLSFYVLLAPLFFWLGGTLLAVRLLLALLGRLPAGGTWPASPARNLGLRLLWAGIRRRPQPLASGVVALALAIAFGVSLGIFSNTYQAEKTADARFVVGGDVRVTPATPPPPDLSEGLRVSGVTAVTAVQTATATVGVDKRTLMAIDARTFGAVADFKPGFLLDQTPEQALHALAVEPGAVLVDVELARAFNVQVGDPVKVQLPDRVSGKPVPLTLHAVGLFKNFPGQPQGVDLVANAAIFRATVHSAAPDFYLLRSDGTDATNSVVAAAITAGPGKSLDLALTTTAKAYNLDQSSLAALNLNGLARLETAYTILMSALGIGIFVFGLLLQRRKEHVTMRALGMRMRQVQVLVLGEAGAVTLLSLVIGTAVGVGMSLMFVQILTPLFTVPPQGVAVPYASFGLVALLLLATTTVASLVAGATLRRAALVELLREE